MFSFQDVRLSKILNLIEFIRMQGKFKILFAGLVVGAICLFFIPSLECEAVGKTFWYISFGVSGLIILKEMVRLLKREYQRYTSEQEPFLRESFLQSRLQNVVEEVGVEELQEESEINEVSETESEQEQEQQVQSEIENGLHLEEADSSEIESEPSSSEEEFEESIENPLFYHNEDTQGMRQTFHQQQCTICLDQFAEDDLLDRQRCGHKFHSACIRTWLQKNSNCPICRLKIR